MIDEQDVEKAVTWMVENATPAAQARANRDQLEAYKKPLLATIMRENTGQPLAAQERDALADPRYLAHLEVLKEAVFQDERMRWFKAAAETKISVWQSQQRAIRP